MGYFNIISEKGLIERNVRLKKLKQKAIWASKKNLKEQCELIPIYFKEARRRDVHLTKTKGYLFHNLCTACYGHDIIFHPREYVNLVKKMLKEGIRPTGVGVNFADSELRAVDFAKKPYTTLSLKIDPANLKNPLFTAAPSGEDYLVYTRNLKVPFKVVLLKTSPIHKLQWGLYKEIKEELKKAKIPFEEMWRS